MIQFEAFPKIPRLKRDIVITEKIDGTNACVVITPAPENYADEAAAGCVAVVHNSGAPAEGTWLVGAQSRNRLITPTEDNAGFAAWVCDNANALVATLGEGRHFGEWWGSGIQRRYGLADKRLSLFNTGRWTNPDLAAVPGLYVVPVLYSGPWSQEIIDDSIAELKAHGSYAVNGYDRPEGVVVYHAASRSLFKVLCENDDLPKSAA